MKILVSCCNLYGGLYEVSFNDSTFSEPAQVQVPGLDNDKWACDCRGMTVAPAITDRDLAKRKATGVPINAGINVFINGWLHRYSEEGVERIDKFGWHPDGHDVAYGYGRHKDHYVICTGRMHSISEVDLCGQVFWTYDTPNNHCSNLTVWNDTIIFISAGMLFGMRGREILWSYKSQSEGDLHCHSLRVHGDRLYWCDSGVNSLESVQIGYTDVSKQRRELENRDGFTRGIAFHDDLLFLGTSASRRNVFGKVPYARLHAYRRVNESWEQIAHVDLPTFEIFDLRIV